MVNQWYLTADRYTTMVTGQTPPEFYQNLQVNTTANYFCLL